MTMFYPWKTYLKALASLTKPSDTAIEYRYSLVLRWYTRDIVAKLELGHDYRVRFVVKAEPGDEAIVYLEGFATPEVLRKMLDAYIPTDAQADWVDDLPTEMSGPLNPEC